MILRHLFHCLLPALCIALAGGCFFEPYRENVRFDLAVTPVEPQSGVPLTVTEFRNDSSAGSRIQYRNSATGQVTTDPYSGWVLPPGELVARALTLSLNSGEESGAGRMVTGSLEIFEVLLPERTFRLAGKFSCDNGATLHRFDYSEPVNGSTPAAVAAAASRAGGRLAESIASNNLRSSKK